MLRRLHLVPLLCLLAGGCGVKAPPIPPDVLVPTSVSGLEANVQEGELHLSWGIPRKNMDGSRPADLIAFNVLRRDEKGACVECPGEFAVRAHLDLRAPQGYRQERGSIRWKDSELEAGTIYIYKVVGVNHWGYPSPPSNQVVVQWCHPPAAPSSLTAKEEDGSVLLSWESATGADAYNVYRHQPGQPSPANPVNSDPIHEERYVDKDLQNETEYLYLIRGVKLCAKHQ